jgi:ADP-heptose:LPS heptosyltransferase
MKPLPSRILLIRLSALGDIAMTAPIVRAYAQAHPDIHFIMASAPLLAPLFQDLPNLQFEPINTKEYGGFLGPFRLFRRLRRLHPKAIFDLHRVLRSYAQSLLFFLCGTPVYALKKGRRARKQLTRPQHKTLEPITSMMARYEAVWLKAGFPDLQVRQAPPIQRKSSQNPVHQLGIAPFAKHDTKMWPLDKVEALIARLSQSGKYHISLLGGGSKETAILSGWSQRYSHTECVAGTLSFAQELALIGSLDLLLSMDSANMHFASFMGTPVISIWGGTHPYTGFYGWRQDPQNALQIDLDCRPCSVFGGKPCARKDHFCLQQISTDTVIQKIEAFFHA